jgi:hypothetical protein
MTTSVAIEIGAKLAGATMPELVKYDAMCRAIDACLRVDEIKEIRDQAAALQAVARVAQNFDAERKAAIIRIRAERRGGELLRDMCERGERRSRGDGQSRSRAPRDLPNLEDLGISHDQSSCWQKLARVPEQEFEAGLTGKRPSTARIINRYGNHPEGATHRNSQEGPTHWRLLPGHVNRLIACMKECPNAVEAAERVWDACQDADDHINLEDMMKLSAWLSEFLPAFKRKIDHERTQDRQSLRASAMAEGGR